MTETSFAFRALLYAQYGIQEFELESIFSLLRNGKDEALLLLNVTQEICSPIR